MKTYTIKGIAHITGGGLYENVSRMSPSSLTYTIKKERIPNNPIFDLLASFGVSEKDMYNTFNMGVGLVICVDANEVDDICSMLEELGEKAFKLGRVEDGGQGVCLI